jgi:Fur family ferric uptake transcriptional regulator
MLAFVYSCGIGSTSDEFMNASAAKSATVDLEELKQRFADFLKKKMYRNTQERYRVLERIAVVDRHFSADELYVHMNNLGDRVSRATIYSTLDLLTRCGLVVKHRFQGGSATYELASRMPHHDHLICRDCGHILEFNAVEVESAQKKIASKLGFLSEEHSLQIFARCRNAEACEHNTAPRHGALLAEPAHG